MSRQTRPHTRLRAVNERGAILILTALVMLVLLIIAAFATDLGAWYRQGQEQQRAADVSSLNGVQGYDVAIKAYVDSKGAARFADLSDAQKAEAEQLAMQDAMTAIITSLTAGGMQITDAPVIVTNTPPAESTATVTAVDGTVITITRTADNGVTVSVNREGTQYFSNIVRDAPEISREGTAVIANCNADCSREIELVPPFPAFAAIGKGDGWGPIIHEDEVWGLNHHNTSSTSGHIICTNRHTQDFCEHTQITTLYDNNGNPYSVTGLYNYGTIQTANRSQPEHVEDGKIYFPARDSGPDEIGLACFDMEARAFCSTAFTGLFSSHGTAWPNTIQIVGPWHYNGDLYMIAQDGRLGCVTPSTMAPCGTWDTDGVGHGDALTSRANYGWGGLDGNLLYLITMPDDAHHYHCWNLATQSSCWGNVQSWDHGWNRGIGAGYAWNFFHRDSNSNVNGICTIRSDGSGSFCVSSSGTSTWTPTTMESYFRSRSSRWVGAAHEFTIPENDPNGDVRAFFTGGWGNGSAGNNTLCWDWATNSNCGTANHQVLSGAQVAPYGLARASETCIVGLGHQSRFFTLDINTMETCDDTTVYPKVFPCDCADGTTRYGILDLPDELKAVLAQATATVTDGNILIENHDLLAGPLDLASFNGQAGPLDLTIQVNSIINPDGSLAWTETYSASLALITQPTLSGG